MMLLGSFGKSSNFFFNSLLQFKLKMVMSLNAFYDASLILDGG